MKLEDFPEEVLNALATKLAEQMADRNFVTFDKFDRQNRLVERQFKKLATQEDLETIEDRCDLFDSDIASLVYLGEDFDKRVDERIGAGFEVLADLYKSRKDN